ncbi:BREX-1 system phosphatase PglZ type A [Allochromatium humboldtianum]|uniref:BREX-1 system phosphatase PglZ type A n=1 Tax=Allochromatium humboldtianum TaxID=504901 RepID=A0A850RF25_9GAMM|nr:BREX-1 system phosphatase PglZ type A [Allochromatium humboldtianum]NVZ09782.1 BREX-1 system phosphatase PglZ type A [Allochromatium humboldtianum]
MSIERIETALRSLFINEGQRIVFWHDPEREFEDALPALNLDDVTLLRLDQEPALAVKVRLGLEDLTGRYLLYAPSEPPDPDDDWLLDMRLYSASFRADRASMLLAELGLVQLSLRSHLAERARFFANRERLERVKKLVGPDDDALDLDRKLMAVVLKSEQAEFFSLLIALFDAIPDANLEALPPAWAELEKYELTAAFWTLAAGYFGDTGETPTLKTLLIRLMVSDLGQAYRGILPEGLRHLTLTRQGTANAVVCLAQWRDSLARSPSYEALSAAVAEAIKLEPHLAAASIEDLVEVKTFLLVEKLIASRLRDRVLETLETIKPDAIQAIATQRQDGYWVASGLPDTAHAPRRALAAVYRALTTAADLFALRQTQLGGWTYPDAKAVLTAYTQTLYRYDQGYRHFCELADAAESRDWDILKSLRQRVESYYAQGFITELALAWNTHLEAGLLNQWRLDDLPNQQRFYAREVAPILAKGPDRRVFVIISDAFRYEVAQELTEQLNGRYRFDAALSAQLGVLPSHTALGMAALLPHMTLDYTDNGALRIDGRPCASLEQRSRILDAVQGVAVKADTFMAMKKDEGRAFVKPYRVVYIYHDRIDAIGDKAATEAQTFAAVRQAIDELSDLVGKIVNSLNGNHLLITADHGFLFQETPPVETDRQRLADQPPGTLTAKKRYLLGRDLPNHDAVFCGSTTMTAGAGGDLLFWVPKGASRFHFVGGSRFVHGGAMPQEIVVPVIRVQHVKDTSKAVKTRVRSVGVSVLGNNFKVTTNRHRFQLIQTEPVGERVKPVTLRIGIYAGEEPVTNVETLTFDSRSPDMNQWKKTVSLTLEGRRFDRRQLYQLILREAETGVEEARFDVTIDLAFSNDF